MIQKIIKLLWPEICPFCGDVYRNGICPACESKLNLLRITQPRCMKCGKPVRRHEQEYCRDCEGKKHHFDSGRALWLHKPPVSQSIYQFKYHNQREFGKYYAREMVRQYSGLIREWNPDFIIPIPLHKRRRRKRGFNQSQIMADEIGKLMDIPVDATVLKRVRYTNPQKILDPLSRQKNLHNAFKVEGNVNYMHTVIIIDDIYTTGNTLDEAAKTLKNAGVQNVFFLTVSIGQGY